MSTNAVAFLLLNKFRNGVNMEKLVEAMEQLKRQLFYAGRDVGFSGEMVDVINHAVRVHFIAITFKIAFLFSGLFCVLSVVYIRYDVFILIM